MRKYPIVLNNGEIANCHYIGVNHNNLDEKISDVISAYNREFDNEDEILLENINDNKRICTLGDIKEAYLLLKNEIAAKGSCNLYQYAECVQKAIINYFGDFSKIKWRLDAFPTEKEIKEKGKERGKVSDLAHKNMAYSFERAIVSQNLLNEIGIESFFKASSVIIDGKEDMYAYNLIHFDKKFYLFDTTIPSLNNDRICPIICEIPREVYYWMANPTSNIGYTVEVNHYNSLLYKDVDIIYDAGRDFLYNANKQYTKVIK